MNPDWPEIDWLDWPEDTRLPSPEQVMVRACRMVGLDYSSPRTANRIANRGPSTEMIRAASLPCLLALSRCTGQEAWRLVGGKSRSHLRREGATFKAMLTPAGRTLSLALMNDLCAREPLTTIGVARR